MAARKTTSMGGIDAVAIAAVLKHPNRPDAVPMCALSLACASLSLRRRT